MSKLKGNNINFNNDDFVIEIDGDSSFKKDVEFSMLKNSNNEAELIINRAKEQANELMLQAQEEAEKIKADTIEEAQKKADELIKNAQTQADEMLSSAQENSKNLDETSKKEAADLIEASKDKIEQERIEVTKKGYDEGYNDGVDKIREELSEKIEDFNNFFKCQYEVKDKIIKAASKDILDIIVNISSKILLREINAQTLDKIIKNAVLQFEKKENINIILSEKYARLLFELQNNLLNKEYNEFDFEKFNQYDGFEVVYNPKFDDDTIIVENLKERFDASINSQLDVIVREIYEKTKNGKLDLENYIEDETSGTEQNNKQD